MSGVLKSLPVYKFASLESTNDKLKEMNSAEDLQEFSVVISSIQTAGRGQQGNSWESERGKNLTFSLLLKPDFIEPQQQFCISKAVSLGITDTLTSIGIRATIKWPNDIYVKNKKIAGILIENTQMGNTISSSIVGIGLNVNQVRFISDAKDPVSVFNILGKVMDTGELLEVLLGNILKRYEILFKYELNSLDKEYFDQLYRKDGKYPFKDAQGIFTARITGIEPSGRIIITDNDGIERKYAFKEVEFLD